MACSGAKSGCNAPLKKIDLISSTIYKTYLEKDLKHKKGLCYEDEMGSDFGTGSSNYNYWMRAEKNGKGHDGKPGKGCHDAETGGIETYKSV